jgi:hypothetical protein
VYGVCSEVEGELTGGSVLPTPQARAAQATGRAASKQQGLPSVRWDSPFLGFDKKTARVIDVRVTPTVAGREKFSDVVAKISIDGQPVLYYFRADDEQFGKLVSWFGSDENKWVDKEFLICLEEDTFDQKRWVRVYPKEEASSAKPGRAGRS